MAEIESVSGNGATGGKENSGGGKFDGPFDKKFAEYVNNLMKERDSLDAERYPLIHRLVQNELSSISKVAVGASQEKGYIDLYGEAPITLSVKAMPPSKMFPKVNFAGRIIGPKGAYLKALVKETKTNMLLLGKGVMKDKDKEDELRQGSDPKYYHLNEDMHVAITVTATAPEAYAKVAYALKCLKELVLTDSRASEEIPWIANPTRHVQGETLAPGPSPYTFTPGPGNGQIGPARQSLPPPSQQSPGAPYFPGRTSYDSPPNFRPPSIHESRPPPGARPAYDYGMSPGGGGVHPYDQNPQHQYSVGGLSGGFPADPYAPRPSTERIQRSSLYSASQPQRFAPY